ncbi:NADP-dependent oxidoreductase [Amycolatopsis jiangsuensis]|uniref:NADPH:quinone reductase-like Zn-dependent oxidoreductase n=1 Tax=Amycolatopsis jiangsuensis TaxID=1181879 RepID=A0A840IPQ7_9PSEU|nr:NADP-dependent oxidoreductase [Amycolatopsis jiangsuensis]MBB4683158.1 NADPH:quinone reductase-like Zn-dependent oxidoreductase [Amycolatopsis jiangsuensis]
MSATASTGTTMRAVQLDVWGGPERLVVRDVARPVPGPGQVRVRVEAASANAVDRRVREGYLSAQFPLPYTAGSDFSGVVEAVGEGADLPVGAPVFGALWPTSGAYAEYAVVDAALLAVKPDGVSFEQAAALPVAGITAWVAVVDDGQVRPGQRVLVQGAAGGVGHIAVQLAKQRGAYVIGTASAANHDFIRDLGADEVLDYRSPDLPGLLADLDLVIDGVSAAGLAAFYPKIRRDGLALSLFDPPLPPPAGIRAQLVATAAIADGPVRPRLAALAKLVAGNQLTVAVTASYGLDEVATAQETRVRGKAVIIP